MSRGRLVVHGLLVAGLSLSLGGCPSGELAPLDVQVPAHLQSVFNDVDSFRAAPNDPFESIAPGTAVDDLSGLDGCWGTSFTESDAESEIGLYVAYHFDAAAGTFARWSTVGLIAGGLWPSLPVVSGEEGTFTIVDANHVLLSTERYLANIDPDTSRIFADVQEIGGGSTPTERTALVTLQGDQMLFFIDVETANDVDEADERAIFFRFECPTG